MNHDVEAIAANLRTLREGRGLSLDQMAELTGVSKSMLRQIETGKSSPTIATLWKIANGLRVSFTSLLAKPAIQAEVKAFRAEKPLTAEGEHYRLYPMIPFNPQQAMETYLIEIDPGTVFHGEPHEGNVHEYLFVTQGQMQLKLADELFEVATGEFLHFQANHPHDYICAGDEMVTAILQISYLP